MALRWWGISIPSSPKPKPIENILLKLRTKSSMLFVKPDPKLGYSLLMIVFPSSPNCSNTFVGGSVNVNLIIILY